MGLKIEFSEMHQSVKAKGYFNDGSFTAAGIERRLKRIEEYCEKYGENKKCKELKGVLLKMKKKFK